MQYVHVRNIEKFHPGYKDRKLLWAKIYFNMVQGDPDCEMIENEIDWARLIKFIILELQAQKPIPMSEKYLEKKGINLKQRKISLTLQALHLFIEVRNETVTEPLPIVDVDVRLEDIQQSIVEYRAFEDAILQSWNSFTDKFPLLPKIKEITETRREHLKALFEKESFRDYVKIFEAIEKQPFLIQGNPESKEHKDWRISFDWLIANDTNYVKVLELKYIKQEKTREQELAERRKKYDPEIYAPEAKNV